VAAVVWKAGQWQVHWLRLPPRKGPRQLWGTVTRRTKTGVVGLTVEVEVEVGAVLGVGLPVVFPLVLLVLLVTRPQPPLGFLHPNYERALHRWMYPLLLLLLLHLHLLVFLVPVVVAGRLQQSAQLVGKAKAEEWQGALRRLVGAAPRPVASLEVAVWPLPLRLGL
jgi:hypothetical protein